MSARTVFVLQPAEDYLKAIRFIPASGREEAVVDFFCENLSGRQAADVLKKFGLKRNSPLLVSLPRNQAVCRYIKIPAQAADEIEKIAGLQAPRYLPYPPNLLITAYQVISQDKEGNSYLNLIIAHKDVIDRCLDLTKKLEVKDVSVALSSWGLCNFYFYLRPQEQAVVMLVDIDSTQAELAVIHKGKTIFSRYFKISTAGTGWEERFGDEIKKTHEAYLKETSQEIPAKIVLTGAPAVLEKFAGILRKNSTLPLETLSFTDKAPQDAAFTSLLGLAMKGTEESVFLSSPEKKEQNKKISLHRRQFKSALVILAIACICAAGLLKSLYNKAAYLKQVKTELNKISAEAAPLEKAEQMIARLETRRQKKPSALEIIYELHQVIPADISLISLAYEEDKQVVIRGQAPELDAVVAFNSILGKAAAFKGFEVRIRFTTNKKTQAGDFVDFEIACLRKK